jgi:hypothetical protein
VVSLLLPDQVGQAKRRFRQAKVDPRVDRIRPGDAPITDLVASGVPVEPIERPARESRRPHGGPGGRRPRRDGDRPRRPYGEGDRGRRDDRPRRPSGERDRYRGPGEGSRGGRSDRPAPARD